jgi:hypothetical protein
MIEHLETEKTLEKLIDDYIKAHKNLNANKKLLESIPCIGKVMSQRMLMVLGTHHFKDAHQCVAYLGVLFPYKKNQAVVPNG